MRSLLEVKNLQTVFQSREGFVKAVDDVSFHVEQGETLGIVGESGCGKSVTCLSILRLLPSPPAKIIGGEVYFQDQNLLTFSKRELRALRGNQIAMVFQDPMTSLNPFLTVARQLTEVLETHENLKPRESLKRSIEMLERVGFPLASERIQEYPHQFSGGMRQRVMIAMALLCRPRLLIADEPTTALDVTIQAQILDLLKNLQKELGMSLILITHNLGVVAGMCDRILVMYAGRIVEENAAEHLFKTPLHPYTRGLLKSVPRLDEERRTSLFSIRDQPPDLSRLPPGCPFHPRCDLREERCFREDPPLIDCGEGTRTACWVTPREKGVFK